MGSRLAGILDDEHADVRLAAVNQSLKSVVLTVLRNLQKAANDDDAVVRQAYIEALGNAGGEDAGRLLVEQMVSRKEGKSGHIDKALRRLGDAAIKPLCVAFDSLATDPLTRSQAIKILSDLQAPEAVPKFERLLISGDLNAQSEAVVGLAKIGDKKALPALENYYVANRGLPEKKRRNW